MLCWLKRHSLHTTDNAICVKQRYDHIHFKSPQQSLQNLL
jgi:hypothetical protein